MAKEEHDSKTGASYHHVKRYGAGIEGGSESTLANRCFEYEKLKRV